MNVKIDCKSDFDHENNKMVTPKYARISYEHAKSIETLDIIDTGHYIH